MSQRLFKKDGDSLSGLHRRLGTGGLVGDHGTGRMSVVVCTVDPGWRPRRRCMLLVTSMGDEGWKRHTA